MNCPACGASVEKTDQFCPKCFERIEPPTFWRRVASFFQKLGQPGPHTFTLKKTVSIQSVDRDGTRHEYKSLAEAPLEMQRQMEELQKELANEKGNSLSMQMPPVETSANTLQRKLITQKTVSIIKFKDAHGQEHTYHSLDELPPEIRAVYEKAMKKME